MIWDDIMEDQSINFGRLELVSVGSTVGYGSLWMLFSCSEVVMVDLQ